MFDALIAIITVVVIAVLTVAYLSWWHPEVLARILLWLPGHLLYRVRVFGRENIPASGPALLVCNHVSFIDAFLVLLLGLVAVGYLVAGFLFHVQVRYRIPYVDVTFMLLTASFLGACASKKVSEWRSIGTITRAKA